jgi:DNA-binding transcriptional MocR family regulator
MTKYQELADRLREDIRSGKLPDPDPDRLPKGRLPTQLEIAARYGCSQGVVNRAFTILKEENVIYTNHAGAFPTPAAGEARGGWHISCCRCPTTFEAPGTLNLVRLREALKRQGWVWRGSGRGWEYYCDTHAPWDC